MSPLTHLLGSWLIAVKTTDNRRDTRLVALSGILPDSDGLVLLMDIANGFLRDPDASPLLYSRYHHFLFHGLPAGILFSALLMLFARQRLRVFLLCMAVFHLHLLCDFVGSRGPEPEDLWPIFYLGPFTKNPMWLWDGQWALNAWPNQLLTWMLLGWALWLAVRRGDSFVGVFSRWADAIFVRFLRLWSARVFRSSTSSMNQE